MGVKRVLLALTSLWVLTTRGSLLPLDTERLRASVGGYAVMNCHLDFPFGNEIPYHLQWDKDGEVIFSWYSGEGAPRVADRWGGRVQRVQSRTLGGGSVNISAVRETDAGLYRCRVSFPNRTPPARNNGTFYYLDVDGGNLIVTPPINVTVLEGEPAELECLPKSHEWSVQWFRDGQLVETLPEFALRSEQSRNGSLLLRRAASTDPAEYECRVSAPDGQVQTASAFLDVQYKAKVVYSPKERYLPYGKSASLDCHFSANPPLTNLRWEKDGFLFDPYNVPGVFYSRNGSLLFNRVDESHEGVYSCTPYNALGSEGPSAGVRVRVLRPPALAARPQPLYVARLGAAVTLPCHAAVAIHDAPPSIRWVKKDGGELPEGRYSLSGGNLTIEAVSEEDRGVYVCRISNEAAELRVESELLIENIPPRAPRHLAAKAETNALHLTWEPGRGGPGVEYTVWYRVRGDGEWRTMKILTRGIATGTLRGLRAGTQYEVRVLAQDQLGDGLFSRPLLVRTLDEEFGDESVTVSAASDTEQPVTDTFTDTDAYTDNDVDTDAADEAHWTLDEEAPDHLPVTVRLIEEGALVVWSASDVSRCELRWYDASSPEPRLLAVRSTSHHYALVNEVEEGGNYWARVRCGAIRGSVELHVPQYARLRGVALGAAAAALLLAALAGALFAARRRLRPARDKRTR